MANLSTEQKKAIRIANAAGSLKKMKGAVFALTGDKRLLKTLNKARDSHARAAMKTGLSKAVRLVAKSIKANVPVDMKAAKPLIGSRIGKAKAGAESNQFTAKAGAAVGKSFKKIAKRAPSENGKKRGVGISGRNIQWFIMGTGERHSRIRKTGRMPPQMPDIVQRGFSAASSEAKAVITREITSKLATLKAR